MSDLLEPEERVELSRLESESSANKTLVSRAIAPLMRVVRGEGLTTAFREIELRRGKVVEADVEPRGWARIIWLSLVIVVALPILTSGIYLFVISSDQYAAETRFAVRSNGMSEGDTKGDTSISSVLNGSGSLAGQDAEIVANYIHSRAIIDDISRTIDLRSLYQRPEADFLARLPNNASAEDFSAYWNKMVSVYIESLSGIVTVEARAFRREDALAITKAIVNSSETLVNTLSSNMRADAIRHAEDEVRRSEGLVRFALADLTAFRNSQGMIDPVKSADQTGKLLVQMMADKLQIEGTLFVSERTTGPNAPGVAATRAKLESIDGQIAALQQQLAGSKSTNANLAAAISRFEELDLKRQFAEKMYGFARDGLERAQLIAERRSIYLTTFVPPSLPEDYSYPLRGTNFILISFAALMTWACGATIWASILDHQL